MGNSVGVDAPSVNPGSEPAVSIDRGSQVQILSARQKCLGNSRVSEAFWLRDLTCPSKTHRLSVSGTSETHFSSVPSTSPAVVSGRPGSPCAPCVYEDPRRVPALIRHRLLSHGLLGLGIAHGLIPKALGPMGVDMRLALAARSRLLDPRAQSWTRLFARGRPGHENSDGRQPAQLH